MFNGYSPHQMNMNRNNQHITKLIDRSNKLLR